MQGHSGGSAFVQFAITVLRQGDPGQAPGVTLEVRAFSVANRVPCCGKMFNQETMP
jgi:hypothetical protein